MPLGGDDGPRPLPEPLVSESTVVEASRLADASGKLFLSCSSLVDSSYYAVLDPAPTSPSLVVVSSPSRQGKALGLSKEHQFSEIWYPGGGGGDYRAHALVLKPPAFDAARSYPLAFLIHGGPQGAWTDSWSTRWNPALFAAQGYVVVLPNPTGSTGYGMALQNGIRDQWGGRPYADLVSCFDYIAAEMPYVDTARAVALGASYGGYMISRWSSGGESTAQRTQQAADLTLHRLDPGPALGPQVQGPGLPRRRLQHPEPVLVRGAVLPYPRVRRHALG